MDGYEKVVLSRIQQESKMVSFSDRKKWAKDTIMCLCSVGQSLTARMSHGMWQCPHGCPCHDS